MGLTWSWSQSYQAQDEVTDDEDDDDGDDEHEHGDYIGDVEENFEAFETGLEFKTSLVEVVE